MSEFITVKMHNGLPALIRADMIGAMLAEKLPDGYIVTRVVFAGGSGGIAVDTPLNLLLDMVELKQKKASKKSGG